MISKFTGVSGDLRKLIEVASWLEQGDACLGYMDVVFAMLAELPDGDARLDRVVVALDGLLGVVRGVQASRRGVMSLGAAAT